MHVASAVHLAARVAAAPQHRREASRAQAAPRAQALQQKDFHASARLRAAGGSLKGRSRGALSVSASATVTPEAPKKVGELESQVLQKLARIIDPDLGANIVECGFVKDLNIDAAKGAVSFTLELTTPACPVKDEFDRKARDYVGELEWVKEVMIRMSASAPANPFPEPPAGLKGVTHVVAVSSCKGGVGKSTVSVNLAYSLAMMGAKVGIFDADIYGPSLPMMTSPNPAVLEMDPATKALTPCEYEGVKLVSFGFAGQGSAIMRGPMVSGLVNQLLTTANWGQLDYLILDLPPGTGDIHLTLCQTLPITAAVVVTTPQKLAFIDVAKGVRMFSRLRVPCVAVVENMAYFEAEGKRYHPFGQGSGAEVCKQFGIPHLFEMPITPVLSAAGDTGRPHVINDPLGEPAKAFGEIAARVVQEVAKLKRAAAVQVAYNQEKRLITVIFPDGRLIALDPAYVRRNDQSAKSVDEWTGIRMSRDSDVPETIEPTDLTLLGNYAAQISWPDGFNQVAPLDQLESLFEKAGPDGKAKR